MRALVCHAYGPIDSLKVEDIPQPVPKAGEVLVKVRAAGVSFAAMLGVQVQLALLRPVGSGSLMTVPLAAAVPPLVAVTVYCTVLPGAAVATLAVLVSRS